MKGLTRRKFLSIAAGAAALPVLHKAYQMISKPPDGQSVAYAVVPGSGSWTPTFPTMFCGIHAAVLPTGKILYFEGYATPLQFALLDLNTLTSIEVDSTNGYDVFCCGLAALPNGNIMLAGGLTQPLVGDPEAHTFNPFTETFTQLPNMTYGRHYPTVTALPDGQMLITSGADGPDGAHQPWPEIYDPVSNTYAVSFFNDTLPLYPFMFVLSDGTLVQVGPGSFPQTWQLDLALGWSQIAANPFPGGSAVCYERDKIVKCGGNVVSRTADNKTAVLDVTQPTPSWQMTTPLNYTRVFHTLVLLPTGDVLCVGGTAVDDTPSQATLVPELWNASTMTWTPLAAMDVPRQYHSTAMLLPDARVLAMGGQLSFFWDNVLNGQIFSPPYLLAGPRPTISSAPGAITYNNNFVINTPDAANIGSVCLMRPACVTHGFDMNQRRVVLNFTVGSGLVTVQSPANANIAPPGYYMLFLVNTSGVPSVATFTKLS